MWTILKIIGVLFLIGLFIPEDENGSRTVDLSAATGDKGGVDYLKYFGAKFPTGRKPEPRDYISVTAYLNNVTPDKTDAYISAFEKDNRLRPIAVTGTIKEVKWGDIQLDTEFGSATCIVPKHLTEAAAYELNKGAVFECAGRLNTRYKNSFRIYYDPSYELTKANIRYSWNSGK